MVKVLFMLGIGTSFIFSSALFFIFPQLLRKPHKFINTLLNEALQGKKLLRISHRGSPRYTTQNTLQAFKKIHQISDMLQMDVCQTLDKILVVHHDKSLMKSCRINIPISQIQYQDLPRYQNFIPLDFVSNQSFQTNHQKIPSLQSIFQNFQGKSINIELKTPTTSAIGQIIRLIHKYNRQNNTIVGIRGKQNAYLHDYNLKLEQMHQNQKKKQQVLLFMNDRAVIKVYLAYFFGVLPFINIRQKSMQIPIYSKQFEEWFVERGKKNGQSSLKLMLSCKMLKLINMASKPLIWHLAKRGITSYGWVCNTQESLQLAKFMGVQGIMSDQPYLLNDFATQFNKKAFNSQ